jgi:hypothetical protein
MFVFAKMRFREKLNLPIFVDFLRAEIISIPIMAKVCFPHNSNLRLDYIFHEQSKCKTICRVEKHIENKFALYTV